MIKVKNCGLHHSFDIFGNTPIWLLVESYMSESISFSCYFKNTPGSWLAQLALPAPF